MTLGAVLVLLGVLLAVISAFVHDHRHNLLAAAIALVGVGVLAGGAALSG